MTTINYLVNSKKELFRVVNISWNVYSLKFSVLETVFKTTIDTDKST